MNLIQKAQLLSERAFIVDSCQHKVYEILYPTAQPTEIDKALVSLKQKCMLTQLSYTKKIKVQTLGPIRNRLVSIGLNLPPKQTVEERKKFLEDLFARKRKQRVIQ